MVRIACIDVGPEGKMWLNENAMNKTVWFHLLHRSSQEIYSKIIIPKVGN